MVFEILDGYFRGISVMSMREDKLVRGVFLEKGVLEEITIFVVCDLLIGVVTRSRERVQAFLETFVDACA